MTVKRPWTEGGMAVEKVGAIWYVVADTNPIASFQSEADARLFASAGAMYEALDWVFATAIPNEHGNFVISPSARYGVITALRAANPAAFTDNPDGQASEPGGETK